MRRPVAERVDAGGPPVTVLTIDDQEVFRRALRGLIAATDGFEQVGEAATGAEGLDLACDRRPDLVFVDVRMPGMDGIETARRMAERVPGAVVVLISVQGEADLPSSLCTAGAAAFLRKQDLSPRILRSLWLEHGGALPRR